MAFAEDPTVFLEDFAENVMFTGQLPTLAIFDNAFERGNVGIGMASTQPALRMPSATVPPALADGAVVVVGGALTLVGGIPTLVGGTSYRYREQEPDGTGWTVLFLERVR